MNTPGPPRPVFDVDENSFHKEVVERSYQIPVLVDFWAPWCGPCKNLGPILEKLAQNTGASFVLAKLNTDQNPALAQRFRVQSLPTVKAFKDGKVVEEFTGAMPEPAVVQFIEGIVPKPGDPELQKAQMLLDIGDVETAISQLRQILRDHPDHGASRILLASTLLELGRSSEAEKVFARIKGEDAKDPTALSIAARLKIGAEAAPLEQARDHVEANPGDVEALVAYGRSLVAAQKYEQGLQKLLEAVQLGEGEEKLQAKTAILESFEVVGNGKPLVREYRSRLSMLLFQ